MSVKRFDKGELGVSERMPNGWLRAQGLITRSGVFVYRKPDGSEFREYRPPDEVFKADSMESFNLLPVTDDHPAEMLDAKNTREAQRGSVSAPCESDGYMRADLLITDDALIKKMEKGKVEISCGYQCELEHTPGEIDGQRYDAIQRNIKGNHVAIVHRARAGRAVSVKMDSNDAEMVSDNKQKQEIREMTKVTINGVTYEASEQLGQAFSQYRKDHADNGSELAQAHKERDEAQAKLDAANEALAAEKAARADAESPERIAAAVAERVALETKAQKVLGAEFKFDGLDAKAIHLAVIGKNSDKDFSERSADYIAARFDAAIEAHKPEAKEGKKAEPRVAEVVAKADSASAFDKMKAANARAWEKTLA